jgi:hypothetical protein
MHNIATTTATPRVELAQETTGITDFTDASNTCGSIEAGVIL